MDRITMNFARVLLAAAAPLICLAADSPEDAIRKAERAWAAAVVARDFAALEKIYAPALVYAHSTGAIENRQQYLDRLRGGAQRYDKIEHESMKIVPYGDSAVSHCIMRMTGTSNGKPFDDHIMMLHHWVRQGGAWRLAAHQTTKIP